MLKQILLIGFIFGVAAVFYQSQTTKTSAKNYLAIGSVRVTITIAASEAERARGLSGRASLGEDEGMLFIFPSATRPAFWMKEMHFPIDIIWLDENWQIAEITKDISPNSFPQTYSPVKPIRYVLEVPAGTASRHDWQIGEKASLTPFNIKKTP